MFTERMFFHKRSRFYKILLFTTAVIITGVFFMSEAHAAEIPGVMTVDLVIFAGQSNMSGTGGNAALSPAVPNGLGYEFRPYSDPSGLHQITEPFGVAGCGYLSEPASQKKGSLVSSFVNAYYTRTGVPVVAVSASRGATDSAYWASAPVKAELLDKYVRTKAYLSSNHITLRRSFVVFLQGESDAIEGTTLAQYQTNITAAFESLFANGLERVYVITPGHAKGNLFSYDAINRAQIDLCAKNPCFTLASTALSGMPDAYMSDEVHFGQTALNEIGAAAAGVCASQ